MILSVIVPVYNIKEYLPRCLETVLAALNAEDEIILVQGNSVDGSRELSIEYQKNYSVIKNIDQNGIGLSDARNCGMKVAKGEYILFVDGDDYVNSELLKQFLNNLRNKKYAADVIVTDYFRYNEETGREKVSWGICEMCDSGLECLTQIAEKHNCFWNVWRNVYRKSFLIENDIYFKENIYAEDIDFTTQVLFAKPYMIMENMPFYHYRIGRVGSLMDVCSLYRIETTISVIKDSIKGFRQLGEWWCYSFENGLQFEYILNIALIQEVLDEERGSAIDLFLDYESVLLPTKDILVILVKKAIDSIGILTFSRILSTIKKVKRKKERRNLLKK